MTDTTVTAVSRPSWLTHPIKAWRAYQAALAERADADAVAAGLTVQVLPNGVRRYRHAHLDQALAAYHARHTAPDQTDLPVAVPVSSDWTPVRLVTTAAAGGWSR